MGRCDAATLQGHRAQRPAPSGGQDAGQYDGLIEAAPAQTLEIERYRDDQVMIVHQRAVVGEKSPEHGREGHVAAVFEAVQDVNERAVPIVAVQRAGAGAVEMGRAAQTAAAAVIGAAAGKALPAAQAER